MEATKTTEQLCEEFLNKIPPPHSQEFLKVIPPGFTFRPTDEQLVVHYLKKKVLKEQMYPHRIKTCDIYKSHPSEICGSDNNRESYFFAPKESIPDRKAGNGFWKGWGGEVSVESNDDNTVVGFKNKLVYYEGDTMDTAVKTNWRMHEYRLNPDIIPSTTILDNCVLAKIYYKAASPPTQDDDYDDVDNDYDYDDNDDSKRPDY